MEILDVEKVLYEIGGDNTDDSEVALVDTTDLADVAKRCHVLVVDDSSVARNQVKRVLEKLGIKVTLCHDGRAALRQLEAWADSNAEELQRLAIVISDVEMPEMDGYTLTSEIRKHEKFKKLIVLLHTSLSGVFDSSLLEHVAADGFLAKFDEAELLTAVKTQIEKFSVTLDERGL
ncbi:MAG TPA: response regulator [Gammaproteobacteria bacterium]|nr:response regulator [Gammaproteobacteria bacterium]